MAILFLNMEVRWPRVEQLIIQQEVLISLQFAEDRERVLMVIFGNIKKIKKSSSIGMSQSLVLRLLWEQESFRGFKSRHSDQCLCVHAVRLCATG